MGGSVVVMMLCCRAWRPSDACTRHSVWHVVTYRCCGMKPVNPWTVPSPSFFCVTSDMVARRRPRPEVHPTTFGIKASEQIPAGTDGIRS